MGKYYRSVFPLSLQLSIKYLFDLNGIEERKGDLGMTYWFGWKEEQERKTSSTVER